MTAPSPSPQAFVPATFLERGVFVPFTAPALQGTRVRPAEREGTELIVPSPAGGRGVYIVSWTGLRELCRPTVHDVKLCDRIADLPHVTPKFIRRAVRESATEGWAGREAVEAAGNAAKEEEQAAMVANFKLLLRLVAQVEKTEHDAEATERASAANLEQRARGAVERIAPSLGRSTDEVAAELEALSALFSDVGLSARADQDARLPRLAGVLSTARDEAAAWVEGVEDEDAQLLARLFIATVDATLACVRPVLRSAHALADDVQGLLRQNRADPDGVSQLLARADWLLDGWDPICGLWRGAEGPAAKRAALVEIAAQLPVLPKEASQWAEMEMDETELQGRRRLVRINEDWRSGITVLDAVARNERLLAEAA